MNAIWSQLVLSFPFLQTVFDVASIILSISFLAAYSGIVFISAIAKIIAQLRKRNAFDKCARQLALLALILGWILLVASRIWLYLDPPKESTLSGFLWETSWLMLSLGVLLTTVYYTLWRILKNMPVLHTTLGMITGAQNCISLVLILFSVRVSSGIQTSASFAISNIVPANLNDPLWNAIFFTLPLVFGLAGAFSGFWLAIRRTYDDFGRDYYNLMIPWCAKWARNCWAVLWCLFLFTSSIQIWTACEKNLLDEQTVIIESIRVLIWLLPVLLWTVVCKSKFPLRHKWTLFLALIISMSFALPYFMDIVFI